MAAIGTLRNKMGGILIVVLVIAMVSFLFMDIGGSGGQTQQYVAEIAVINGEPVSTVEFNNRFDLNLNNYRNQSQQARVSDEERNTVRQNTYDELVQERLLKQVFEKTGILVTGKEYADMLTGKNQHPTVKSSFSDESGNFSQAQFDEFIRTLDIDQPGSEPGAKRKSWENFERFLLQDRLTTKYRNLVSKGLTIPSWLVEAEMNKDMQQVSFDYIFLPYRDIADAEISVTDEELKKHIQENAKEFKRDESIDLKLVAFNINPSSEDVIKVKNLIEQKTDEWATSKNDSIFIRLNSEVPFNNAYQSREEFEGDIEDDLFESEKGTIFGPFEDDNSFVSYKLLDKKMIADSLKARHLLISAEKITSQEEYGNAVALRDSLFDLITNKGVALVTLTPTFSDDDANKFDGGDLGTIQQGMMVKPFNDMIFYKMKEGDVKMVETEFGFHIVEVYSSKPTTEAVKVAELRKNIYPSDETQRAIYQTASSFAGNHRDRAAFESAEGVKVLNAETVSKERFTITQIPGNARELIKWSFNNKEGVVSAPFSIGDAYVVAMVDKKRKEGVASLDEVRFIVEADVIKQKKAVQLKMKAIGSDLATIASSTSKSIGAASGLSFKNVNISGVGNEPKVVGAALGLESNQLSTPIAGNAGVFVVKTTNKTENQASLGGGDNFKQSIRSNWRSVISSGLTESLKESAEIKDNRFEIF